MIKPTFVTEFGKNFSIYGLSSFSRETKENNKLDLIRPSDSLNFQLLWDAYKNSLTFELGKVHENKSYTVTGGKVFNFGILRSKKNKTLRRKRSMGAEIVDEIQILGVLDKNINFLNPIVVSISSDDLIRELTKYKKYRYRFVLESLVFSSNFENNTNVIFVSCEGLNDPKEALINPKLQAVLGVCYLNKIKSWELVKGQSQRSQAIFTNSEQHQKVSHFSFGFITRNLSDLLNFTVTLLDSHGKELIFPNSEKI